MAIFGYFFFLESVLDDYNLAQVFDESLYNWRQQIQVEKEQLLGLMMRIGKFMKEMLCYNEAERIFLDSLHFCNEGMQISF